MSRAFTRCFTSTSSSSLPCRREIRMYSKRRVSLDTRVRAAFDRRSPFVLKAACIFRSFLLDLLSPASSFSLTNNELGITTTKKNNSAVTKICNNLQLKTCVHELCKMSAALTEPKPIHTLIYRASRTLSYAECSARSAHTPAIRSADVI